MKVSRIAIGLAAATLATLLGACSSGASFNIANSQSADPSTNDYPIFYVKRTIPTTDDLTAGADDVRMMRVAFPSADLYKRASASPSAIETNITSRITAATPNMTWDVKDVDTSPDGTRVVFAMRGPMIAKQQQKNAPSWRIYQYVISTDTLTPVINPTTDPDPPTVNDVSPHYLPDGRIVFSTTRQSQSEGVLLDEGKPQFVYQNEAKTEPAFVLEVMNADGTGVHQISFNQSDDRDATVLSNGRVLWTRWDNAPGGTNAMHLYSSNPDGTDTELYYGANSHMTGTNNTVVEFMRPREMQSGGILSLIRQFSDTDFGGDLVIINGTDYVENTQPLLSNAGATGPAQTRATPNQVSTIPGPSPGGRFNSAYPLWDGTNRILVSWEQCRIQNTDGTIGPCTDTALEDPNAQTAPPLYSVWMFDPTQNTLLPVMEPVEGVMVTDVVATQPRPLQNIILDKLPGVDLDQDLVDQGVGVVDIKSVYDFDGVDTAVPNIQAIANPIMTPAAQRPARFVRVEKAVSIPDMTVVKLSGDAFGASNFMREIIGYAPVEPDGSVKIQVPADVAFRIAVLDANGRNISPGLNAWLQAIPGEVVSCNGCHKPPTTASPLSHGRSGVFAAVYGGSVTGTVFPGTLAATQTTGMMLPAFLPNAGETMAQARSRITCATGSGMVCSEVPNVNVLYTDVWTDPTQATPGAPITLSYNDLTTPEAIPTNSTCASAWASNCRVIINYPEHIQPIWDLVRAPTAGVTPTPPYTCNQAGGCTCSQAACHSLTDANGAPQAPAGQLNLTSAASNDVPVQPVSYRQLLFQHDQQIVTMGALVNQPGPPDANGNPTVITVGPYLNAGSANGGLSAAFLNRFATGSGSTHAGYLSPAELRLLSEWLDIGAQFFNNPFDPAVPVN
jgi:Hydrazine synthase alpha subunit middle domain